MRAELNAGTPRGSNPRTHRLGAGPLLAPLGQHRPQQLQQLQSVQLPAPVVVVHREEEEQSCGHEASGVGLTLTQPPKKRPPSCPPSVRTALP